nr:unnamed protein product [Spirometra erinaceieuropaei]
MNGSHKEIDTIINNLKSADLDPNVDIVLGAPACYLQYAQEKAPKGIHIAAENCYKLPSGAFTGEISPAMIKDCGCQWSTILVTVGAPRRRFCFTALSSAPRFCFDSLPEACEVCHYPSVGLEPINAVSLLIGYRRTAQQISDTNNWSGHFCGKKLEETDGARFRGAGQQIFEKKTKARSLER